MINVDNNSKYSEPVNIINKLYTNETVKELCTNVKKSPKSNSKFLLIILPKFCKKNYDLCVPISVALDR